MRQIHVNDISKIVKEMCIDVNYNISHDIENALAHAVKEEKSTLGVNILNNLIENAQVAKAESIPLCQDTGMVVVFVEIGQEVLIAGGDLEAAIQQGIRDGYKEGYLRKSVVNDPLIRENTGDNTPGVVYYEIVGGEVFKISLTTKGFGSENMSRSKMLKPSDGILGVEAFVLETIEIAGSNPCPPIVVGVGIGGTLDKAAVLAKKALIRDIALENPLKHVADLENRLLDKINRLGIGPQGLGGTTTALGVNIETYPTHIAGLPVVVNINCHASRHLVKIL